MTVRKERRATGRPRPQMPLPFAQSRMSKEVSQQTNLPQVMLLSMLYQNPKVSNILTTYVTYVKSILSLDLGAASDASGTNSDQSPSMSVVQALASGVDVAPSEDGKYPVKKPAGPAPPPKSIQIPDSHTEICRTALERHRQVGERERGRLENITGNDS